MDEEFHSIIKLISGEEILALVCVDDNDGDPVITLKHPIIMKMIANSRGMYVKVKPWVELSDEDIFINEDEATYIPRENLVVIF